MPNLSTLVWRTAGLCTATMMWTAAPAQMAVFKNFKHYPAGQWQQELVGYRDGKALGPPETTARCSGPLDPKTAAGLADMAKASGQRCTTKVLIDQERLAESETVCQLGANVQTVHTQMRAVDDRTILSETRSSVAGQPGTTMKSKATFLGACPAGAAATAARPSAEDCAELAKARQDSEAAGGAGQCAQLPQQYRAQCEAGLKMMATIAQQCQ